MVKMDEITAERKNIIQEMLMPESKNRMQS